MKDGILINRGRSLAQKRGIAALARLTWGLALLAALAAGVQAAVPTRMAFQGKLLDKSKNPRNGTFSMTFRVCDTESGSCASPVWTETQAGVSVANGVFAVELGAVTALTGGVFGSDQRWLEIAVGGETLSPRERLATSPYAFRAAVADDLLPGNTNYIQTRDTLQSGATFYVSSGTVNGNLRVGGIITAGTGPNDITTAAGLLDAAKLTGTVPNASLDASSVTKQGNTFNAANKLILADASGLVPNANLDTSSVTKQGNSFNAADKLLRLDANARVPLPQVTTGTVVLLYADEVDSAEVNLSVAETAPLKSFDLPANSYTTIIVEAELQGRYERDATSRLNITWRFYEGVTLRKTFNWRIISMATAGADSGNRVSTTLKTSFPGGQGATTTLSVTGQMTVSDANAAVLAHGFRVYGVK